MADFINISELTEFGEKTPPGEYTVKLTNVIPKKSKANSNPMLELHWEVDGGDADGNTIRQWLTLKPYENPKTHKISCGAVSDIRKMREAIGHPIPANYNFPLDENKAGKELQPLFGKKLHARVTETPDKNDPEKMYTRIAIKGAVGGAVKVGAGSLDDFA